MLARDWGEEGAGAAGWAELDTSTLARQALIRLQFCMTRIGGCSSETPHRRMAAGGREGVPRPGAPATGDRWRPRGNTRAGPRGCRTDEIGPAVCMHDDSSRVSGFEGEMVGCVLDRDENCERGRSGGFVRHFYKYVSYSGNQGVVQL